MSKSSLRGIFLSLILIFALTVISIPIIAYAENEIKVESLYFEKGTIIEFTNEGKVDVESFRIWLGSDFNFESFKSEEGWVGDKTPEGVIIFSSTEPLEQGSSVKFGVKTDKPKPGINWKALDKKGEQLSLGKSIPSNFGDQVSVSSNTSTINGIFENSFFRIIPDKPNAGGTIRVLGDNFGQSQEFEFFINTKKLGSFFTDNTGYFITTFQIPENQKSERVDFFIKDKTGDSKNISLILGSSGTNLPSGDIVKLTIKGIPDVMHRGDFLEISGTAQPGSAITASVKNPDNEIINTRTAEVTAKGTWKLSEPIIVPLDTPFGKYSAEISDGRESIVKTWTVESSKVIVIAPTSLKFEPGETLEFNGTALPNLSIELILRDPLSNDQISDIFELDETGIVEFEYDTIANVHKEGTWTLIATQGNQKEYIYVGLGELPTIPINIEFDKLNYKTTEKAVISLTGKPSEVITLLIIDPSDNPKGEAIPITLKPDGRESYSLDLTGYSSGIYSAIISKGSAKSTATFTVGLQTGSGEINIGTTKDSYQPGDPILILGDTKPNVLLTITLIDPNGNEVKTEQVVSDKNGQITENTFRIPSEAESGIWEISAKSGSNFDSTEIEVNSIELEGLIITVEAAESVPTLGQIVTIKVIGAEQTIAIEIFSDDGKLIEKFTPFPASKEGQLIQPWIVPSDLEPGNYIFKVKDAHDTAETTYEIK
ncbi:MAG: biofilm-associated protein [Nitrosopumilus sp.]|nr:biofilm-associated protein [Nitrosopumilus sp.]MDH3385925.1 biofilm-associated protein [Nitrosopumilus sp.]